VDNGASAFDLVKENLRMQRVHPDTPYWHYSLILLDYSMPKMDGPTTSVKICDAYRKEIEEYGRDVQLPHIVCLTAFTEKIFEEKARESGMSEFVSKPISNAKLKQILRDCNLISKAEAAPA
jgi:CheY-like chemotaxis protein